MKKMPCIKNNDYAWIKDNYFNNTPVESVYHLQTRFDACNKTNLPIHVFEKHDHDLNFTDWLLHHRSSEGFAKLFETAGNI